MDSHFGPKDSLIELNYTIIESNGIALVIAGKLYPVNAVINIDTVDFSFALLVILHKKPSYVPWLTNLQTKPTQFLVGTIV